MTAPGRNDPCPCGSGRKYKHCRLHRRGGVPRVRDETPAPGTPAAGWEKAAEQNEAATFSERLRAAMQAQRFEGLAEAQEFVHTLVARHNQGPAPGFDGLSPDQMQALLYAPHDHPDLLTMAGSLEAPPRAPMLAWFCLIADALGDPAFGPEPYPQDPDKVRREDDVFLLHYTHVTARDDAGVYLRPFDALAHRIDWRYGTHYHDLGMLQNAWPFLIRLLQRDGGQPRRAGFYVGALFEAFPALEDAAVAGAEPWIRDAVDPYDLAHRLLRHGVEVLAFERFARPLGLVTLERHVPDRSKPLDRTWMVEATPLAREVVRFTV